MAQSLQLLKLLQLSSPTLPVGAFAYSQGLESAIETGLISNAESTQTCLEDSLRYSLQQTDVPLFSRLYQAWLDNDLEQVSYWNQFLRAQRETKELRDEDQQLGIALARLLFDLGIAEAEVWKKNPNVCFLTLFTLAAVKWKISCEKACTGYLWSWLDNQIAAAIKLVPLGQTNGQKILSNTIEIIPDIVHKGLTIKTAKIGASLPMLAILSAQHETQYSRLFRS
ncbi:MAG TPA: urease accessory protein UreF [Leucothrix mucor]|nr:urease accessory protein UreF [Leucothrix mucor]